MRVERLPQAERDTVVDVLTDAFRDYPVMRYVIGDATDYRARLESLIGYYCDKRFVSDWPVLGIRHQGDLGAVAVVSEPTGGNKEKIAELEADLRTTLGEEAFERMVRFESASDVNEPSGSHHFLGMLGVRYGIQSRGYGKKLLQRVKELAIEAGTRGVCLSTEDPGNVPIYQHLGFEVVAEAYVETLHTWCLYWTNPDL